MPYHQQVWLCLPFQNVKPKRMKFAAAGLRHRRRILKTDAESLSERQSYWRRHPWIQQPQHRLSIWLAKSLSETPLLSPTMPNQCREVWNVQGTKTKLQVSPGFRAGSGFAGAELLHQSWRIIVYSCACPTPLCHESFFLPCPRCLQSWNQQFGRLPLTPRNATLTVSKRSWTHETLLIGDCCPLVVKESFCRCRETPMNLKLMETEKQRRCFLLRRRVSLRGNPCRIWYLMMPPY